MWISHYNWDDIFQRVVPAKLVRRGPTPEIRRSARCCIIIFRVAGELGHPGWGAGTLWWGALVDANAILSQKLIFGIKMFRVRRLGNGVEVVRRESEGEWGARCCVRVTTRRLLEEQMAVVVAADSGTKDDAMWHVPQVFLNSYHTGFKHVRPTTVATLDDFSPDMYFWNHLVADLGNRGKFYICERQK